MIAALPTYDHTPDDSPSAPCARCTELARAGALAEELEWKVDKLISRITVDGRAWNFVVEQADGLVGGRRYYAWSISGPGYYARGTSPTMQIAKIHATQVCARLVDLPSTFMEGTSS
jgi:hypothetical protein